MSKHEDVQDHLPATIDSQPSSHGEMPKKGGALGRQIKTWEQEGKTTEVTIRLSQVERYHPAMDALNLHQEIFGSSAKPNLFVAINKQIKAKCQVKGVNDPDITRRQQIAMLDMYEIICEVEMGGLQAGLNKEEIKKNRNERLTAAALYHGLGTKSDLKLAKKRAKS